MTREKTSSTNPAKSGTATESHQALRLRAEEKARLDEESTIKTLSLDDARQLFHELRVYQIELEIQSEELRRSENLYRSILQTMLEGYWLLDIQGRFIDVNEAYCKIIGYSRDELLGMAVNDVEALESEADIADRIQSIVDNGAHSFETRHRCKDGRIVDFAISVNHLPDEDKVSVFLRDITERKQADRALQARLRISDYAFGHSLDELLTKFLDEAEVLTDSQIGFFHFVDADQVNLSLQAWSTNTLSSICTAEGKGSHYPLESAGVWADCIRERRPVIHNNYESIQGRKGLPPGHAPVQRELVVPVIRNNLIVAVLGVGNKPTDYTAQELSIITHLANLSWDIIKRKTAEDEMRLARGAAEAANLAKSDFLSTMSHEIRTPLSAMMGNIELLEDSPLSLQQQEYLRDCKSASQMLLQVINDVLDFSKIEAGKLELSSETFSISELSAQLTRMFSAGASKKGLKLTAMLADNLPEYIACDQQRLRQIIANLISNAIKFTHQGQVSLEINCDQATTAEGLVQTLLHIAVKDTGIGIPEDRLEHVFDSFTRVEGFSTRSTSGTGLGLPITRRLLALMGGSVTVSSVLGEGSVFTIDLPVLIAAAPVQAQTGPQARTTTPRNILLADDDERGRVVAQKLLQRRGYKVTAVENGARLLEALQKGQFDIVLTDISMPDMDGTNVARIIRSGELSGIDPLIPIVAMTAHAFSQDRDRFLAAGITGYVSKPINLEDLISQIEKLCG